MYLKVINFYTTFKFENYFKHFLETWKSEIDDKKIIQAQLELSFKSNVFGLWFWGDFINYVSGWKITRVEIRF